jgi:hypothetical protein
MPFEFRVEVVDRLLHLLADFLDDGVRVERDWACGGLLCGSQPWTIVPTR